MKEKLLEYTKQNKKQFYETEIRGEAKEIKNLIDNGFDITAKANDGVTYGAHCLTELIYGNIDCTSSERDKMS